MKNNNDTLKAVVFLTGLCLMATFPVLAVAGVVGWLGYGVMIDIGSGQSKK